MSDDRTRPGRIPVAVRQERTQQSGTEPITSDRTMVEDGTIPGRQPVRDLFARPSSAPARPDLVDATNQSRRPPLEKTSAPTYAVRTDEPGEVEQTGQNRLSSTEAGDQTAGTRQQRRSGQAGSSSQAGGSRQAAVDVSTFANLFRSIVDNVGQAVLGKEDTIALCVTALIAGGHVLLEDNPGTGKTQLSRALAASIAVDCKRIQFTPDLLPSDLLGVTFYDQAQGRFSFRPGPVFASLVLADEINRASPKTQSALLEVMEEGQVTVDGRTYRLPRPFMVMATQNPIEQLGTYALPEAQMDRFLIRTSLGRLGTMPACASFKRPTSATGQAWWNRWSMPPRWRPWPPAPPRSSAIPPSWNTSSTSSKPRGTVPPSGSAPPSEAGWLWSVVPGSGPAPRAATT